MSNRSSRRTWRFIWPQHAGKMSTGCARASSNRLKILVPAELQSSRLNIWIYSSSIVSTIDHFFIFSFFILKPRRVIRWSHELFWASSARWSFLVRLSFLASELASRLELSSSPELSILYSSFRSYSSFRASSGFEAFCTCLFILFSHHLFGKWGR